MSPVLRDVDVLVVGGNAVGLLVALQAAQRYMQVVRVDGSEVFDDELLVLDDESLRILGAAGLHDKLRSVTNVATGEIQSSVLVLLLEHAVADAGVRAIPNVRVDSFEMDGAGRSVDVTLRDSDGIAHSCATRWLVSTDAAVRNQLDVDVDEIGAVSIARQFRAGPVFLAGPGACVGSPQPSDALARGLGDSDNLTWRLQAVHQGHAHDRLLDAYDAERHTHAAASLTAGAGRSALQIGQLAGSHLLIGRPLAPVSIDGRSLESRLSQGWAILTSDVELLPHDLLARWVGIGTRIVMLGDALNQVAGAPRDGMVIVRPDRVVAAVALDDGALDDVSEQLMGWYADGEPVGRTSD